MLMPRTLPTSPTLVAAAPQANTGCEAAHILGVFTTSNFTRVSLAPTVVALGPAVTDGERSGWLRGGSRVIAACRRRVSRCVTIACRRTCLAPAAAQSNANLVIDARCCRSAEMFGASADLEAKPAALIAPLSNPDCQAACKV